MVVYPARLGLISFIVHFTIFSLRPCLLHTTSRESHLMKSFRQKRVSNKHRSNYQLVSVKPGVHLKATENKTAWCWMEQPRKPIVEDKQVTRWTRKAAYTEFANILLGAIAQSFILDFRWMFNEARRSSFRHVSKWKPQDNNRLEFVFFFMTSAVVFWGTCEHRWCCIVADEELVLGFDFYRRKCTVTSSISS